MSDMRSELIEEILTVESEAERIVTQAKEQCRKNLQIAHETGEQFLRTVSDQERSLRFEKIERIQAESKERIERYRVAAETSLKDTEAYDEIVNRASARLMNLLCSSKCIGEGPAK